MPQSHEERNQPLNWFLPSPIMQTPLFAIVAEMSATLLEAVATAQKEWANFVERRIQRGRRIFASAHSMPLACRDGQSVRGLSPGGIRAVSRTINKGRAARAIYCGASREIGGK